MINLSVEELLQV